MERRPELRQATRNCYSSLNRPRWLVASYSGSMWLLANEALQTTGELLMAALPHSIMELARR